MIDNMILGQLVHACEEPPVRTAQEIKNIIQSFGNFVIVGMIHHDGKIDFSRICEVDHLRQS